MNIGRSLREGDRIGLVAPANFVDREVILDSKKALEKLGFKVVLGKSCMCSWFSFAGRDEKRAEDINEMFRDNSIDGIICIRGGYGCIRLLDMIDYDLIRKNPKVFVGYSDITSLHIAFNQKANLATFHGPMAVSNILNDFDLVTRESFYQSISEDSDRYEIRNQSERRVKVLKSGRCEGEIIGGNLAVLVSTLGTEYEIDTRDKIFFIEEIGEASYKVDRMLMQLKQAGKFRDARGVILGDFADCSKEKEVDFSLEEVFEEVFRGYEKPIISEVASGHCKPMLTIPFGVKSIVDTEKKSIEVIEKTVD